MSIFTTIGDGVLSKVTGYVGDEYQESMVHKSQTVAFSMVPPFAFLAGAILAWALPGQYSWLSFLVFLPVAGPELISSGWLKAHAPRPKGNFKGYLGLTLVNLALALVMVSGIAFNMGDGQWSLIIGAIVGGAMALVFTPRILARRNAQDEKRLNAQAAMQEDLQEDL